MTQIDTGDVTQTARDTNVNNVTPGGDRVMA